MPDPAHQLDGHQLDGHPPDGHQLDGHPPDGHQLDGHPPDGHQLDGHPPDGHQLDGHPPDGHQLGLPPAGLDEATRPRAPRHPDAAITATGRAGADALVYHHDNLRAELEQIRGVIGQVASGQTDAAAARSLINHMSMRQNYWSLGAFCASYCRVVTIHHTIEDQHMFVALRGRDADLGPVLDRLGEEHEVIADLMTRLDQALVTMVTDPDQLPTVRAELERLAEALLSHLAYEEDQLLEPIARLGIAI